MRTRLGWPLAAALILVCPAIVRAQNAPPAQIGNTYDDMHHEPPPGPTHSAEAQAGVALSAQQQQSQVDELQQLDRQIEKRAHKDTGVPVGCPPGDKACLAH